MNANPVKSPCTSTPSQLSDRAGADTCLFCTTRSLPRSWLQEWYRERGDYAMETAFSPESMAGSSEAIFNGSPFCAKEIVGGFWS